MKRLLIGLAAVLCSLAGNVQALGTLAELTVYDRKQMRALPVYSYEGRYYVVGKPGNEYQIVVHNQSGADILTVVSVDGVNAITGETAAPEQSGYVLAPWESYKIKGWRKSMENTAAFYFTAHENSYAARTGRPDNTGVIGVAVFKRYLQPQPLSEDKAELFRDEPAQAASAERDAAPKSLAKEQRLGTGHGRNEESYATYTSFERSSDTPDELITLHYNSYRNLVALGVIPSESAPWNPSPFPAHFVPDPPGLNR